MDPASLASAMIGMQQSQLQGNLQADMLRINAGSDASVVKMIEAGQQSLSLANVGPGIGGNLNVSA